MRSRKTTAGAILAIVGMTILSACGEESTNSENTVQGEGDVTEETVETVVKEEGIVLLLDGWSGSGISLADLKWSTMGGEKKSISFKPAAGEDLKYVAEIEPEAVRRVAARMYSADPKITCDAEGCKDSTGAINFETISDIGNSPVHGAMYQAWGIKNGAWIATIPSDFANIWYGTRKLNVTREAVSFDDLPELNQAAGRAIAISVAFGQVYPTTPLWLDGGVVPTVNIFDTAPEGESITPIQTGAGDFLQGTHADIPEAMGLGAGLLTWMSSPTTGCGSGVLCVPGIVKTETKASELQRFEVCSEGLRGVLEQGSINMSYTYPKPTHQFGVWGGADADGNQPGGTPLWKTTPPYAEGPVEIHYEYAHLYDRYGIYQRAGRTSVVGEDPVEDTSRVPNEADLAVWFGGAWQICSSETSETIK